MSNKKITCFEINKINSFDKYSFKGVCENVKTRLINNKKKNNFFEINKIMSFVPNSVKGVHENVKN
jgi:hypothetical protein